MTRQDGPSSYDPSISFSDVREFKRLLRLRRGVSQNIHTASRESESLVVVRTGGPIGGDVVYFERIDDAWVMRVDGSWIT